jgi:hypothetical protein
VVRANDISASCVSEIPSKDKSALTDPVLGENPVSSKLWGTEASIPEPGKLFDGDMGTCPKWVSESIGAFDTG